MRQGAVVSVKAKDERATKEDASSVAASWEIVTRMAAAAAAALCKGILYTLNMSRSRRGSKSSSGPRHDSCAEYSTWHL
jgi:hypothetical protein